MKSFLDQSARGGISKFENTGIYGSFKFASNLDIRKKVDSISCGQNTVVETGSFTGLPLWIVPCTDGYAYAFCKGGKIFKRDSTTKAWTLVYTDAYGDILGAEEMPCMNGKSYLFWATSTRLNCKEIPGHTNWDDVNSSVVANGVTYTYPKTNLTAVAWHTAKTVNGVLLICNGSLLAMVGYDGSYTPNALDMIPGNLSKCLIDRGLESVIGTYSALAREQSILFKWDQDAKSYLDRKNIAVPSINAIVDTETPLMQVGSNGLIYTSDTDRNIIPIVQLSGGGHVNPDAVEVDQSLALFGSFGNTKDGTTVRSGIYSYGRKDLGHPVALNCEYAIDCTEIGSVKKVGSDLLVSYSNTTPEDVVYYWIARVDTTTKAVGTYQSLDKFKPANYGEKSPNWASLVITTAPLPTGCKIEAYYRTDKSDTWKQANLPDGDTAFDIVGGKTATFYMSDFGDIFEYFLLLTPYNNTTPEVYTRQIMFE